jgi:hypothetical protein
MSHEEEEDTCHMRRRIHGLEDLFNDGRVYEDVL